jgi:hypothetical protein
MFRHQQTAAMCKFIVILLCLLKSIIADLHAAPTQSNKSLSSFCDFDNSRTKQSTPLAQFFIGQLISEV